MSNYPKLNSEHYESVTKLIMDGIRKIGDLTKLYDTFDEKIRSNNYSGQLLREMTEDRAKVRHKIDNEKDNYLKAVKEYCNKWNEELRSEDDLNPADIVDGDLKLLTSNIPLTMRDIDAMVERNRGNRTMLQIIIRHCDQKGIQTGIFYEGNSGVIRNVDVIPEAAKVAFRYGDGMEGSAGHIYDKLLGEGSDLANIFSPDRD